MKRIWRGRVRDRVWKAFVALAGETVRTTDLIERVWPRKSKCKEKTPGGLRPDHPGVRGRPPGV
jgi:hypothetical protein